ncbi:DUF3955 domain-containing protein [Aeromonas piscicola]|uniref:DUF3955 domain-containing protein n=1 Tax=Aeromonas piscicola TaxID=600645 RepID=A0ABT7QAZ0_9GAMM|nr:DUF3955 domain-containing protein [Aeromonas piscicola]MDM5131126.1 DUF3955 domain-containing protein [Aeromonas piscicola]
MMMKLAALFTALGMISLISFNLLGSYVDSQGYLHEPFGLLPIGFLFIFMGILLALLSVLRAFFRQRRTKAEKQAS